MGEFAGWELPIDYGSVVREVKAVRTAAGLFDVSHMGRLDVSGPDTLAQLQALLTNDLSHLTDGGGLYTLMCNPDGGIVEDLIVFRQSEDCFMLVVNASNAAKDEAWISEHLRKDVKVLNLTQESVLFALQGPASAELLTRAGLGDAAKLRRFHFTHSEIIGYGVFISRTGYTGEDGFEIACRSEHAEDLWKWLLVAGEEHGIMPCGLASRDVLRIEAGYPLYGHEIDENTTPVEASLMRFVKLDKGDFIGRDAITAVVERGANRKLCGIIMDKRVVPRSGEAVLTQVGEGTVTSGTYSPTLNRGIALAYLPVAAEWGENVQVVIHGTPHIGKLTPLPIYSPKKV